MTVSELLCVVEALFVFYRELQYLLYLPEQLFLETQNCALNVLNGFGGVVQRQRTGPAANQGFCSYSLSQETISLTNFCILLSFLCLPHNGTSSVFFFNLHSIFSPKNSPCWSGEVQIIKEFRESKQDLEEISTICFITKYIGLTFSHTFYQSPSTPPEINVWMTDCSIKSCN